MATSTSLLFLAPSPMILPRANGQMEGVSCPSGYTNCTSTTIIPVTDDGSQGSNNSRVSGPPGYEKPGPHRYIGVGMVVGMVVVVLVLWLTLGKWPRRMAKAHCCCHRKEKRLDIENEEGSAEDRTDDTHIGQEKNSNSRTGLAEGQKAGAEQHATSGKISHVCREASHELGTR